MLISWEQSRFANLTMSHIKFTAITIEYYYTINAIDIYSLYHEYINIYCIQIKVYKIDQLTIQVYLL